MKKKWPDELGPALYNNEFLDQFITKVIPDTEASVVALVAQFLCAFGNAVGPKPYLQIGSDFHRANLFVNIVGNSSKARKGTSWSIIKLLVSNAEKEWFENCHATGLSSGEGLIERIRDPRVIKTRKEAIDDPGIKDKRLFIQESEFTSILKNFGRSHNKLSEILRNAWDCNTLQNLTRHDSLICKNPYISIVAHVTEADLQLMNNTAEIGNGFGNRFLWFVSKRSKLISFPRALDVEYFRNEIAELTDTIYECSKMEEIVFPESLKGPYDVIYKRLSTAGAGAFGSMTARSEAQTMRLIFVYALLDKSKEIQEKHIESALDLWRYAAQSCQYIWSDSVGNDDADKILSTLRQNPDGLTRTEISKYVFKNNKNKEELNKAFALLEELGLAECYSEASKGVKSTQIWRSFSPTQFVSEFKDLTKLSNINDQDREIRKIRKIRSSVIPCDPEIRTLTHDPYLSEEVSYEVYEDHEWPEAAEGNLVNGQAGDYPTTNSDEILADEIPFEPTPSREVSNES